MIARIHTCGDCGGVVVTAPVQRAPMVLPHLATLRHFAPLADLPRHVRLAETAAGKSAMAGAA